MYSRPAVEHPRFLALGELRAGPGGGEEGRDAGGAGADALGHRALRHDFQLDLPGREDLLEQHRAAAAREAAHDLAHAALADQPRHALAKPPGRVVHDDEVLRALLDQPVDQRARLADLREAGDQHGRAVLDPVERLGHRADEFVDHSAPPILSVPPI